MRWTGQLDVSAIMKGYGSRGQRRQKALDMWLMHGSKARPGENGQEWQRIHLED